MPPFLLSGSVICIRDLFVHRSLHKVLIFHQERFERRYLHKGLICHLIKFWFSFADLALIKYVLRLIKIVVTDDWLKPFWIHSNETNSLFQSHFQKDQNT